MSRFLPSFRTPQNGGPALPRPYQGESLVTLPTEAGMLMIPASDGVIRPYLERHGDWEPEEAALLRQFFRAGLRFLDVGANVGYFSLYVAARCRGAVIHAFEPHPVTSHVLALNAWSSRADITTHAMALSAGERIVTLTTAESNLGDTRASAGAAGAMVAPAAALDDVLPDAVFDLIKIDVQGFETEAIAGMSRMLARSPGAVIVAEFWPAALRERGLDPVTVLRDYEATGFDVRVQVENDLARRKPRDVVALCDTAGASGQVNLVLTRRS